jgi:hypothetical protein
MLASYASKPAKDTDTRTIAARVAFQRELRRKSELRDAIESETVTDKESNNEAC